MKLALLILFLSCVAIESQAIELEIGLTKSDENWKNLVSFLYDRNYYPYSVYLTSDSKKLFAFRTGISVYDFQSQKKIYGKKLVNWPLFSVMAGEIPSAVKVLQGAGVYETTYASQYWEVTDPSEIKTGENVIWQNRYRTVDTHNHYGCLAKHPLRYGDLDGGSAELVLFNGTEMTVFSTISNQVVFAFNWVNADEVSEATMNSITNPDSDHRFYKKYQSLGDNSPQYVASSSQDRYVDDIYPAWRSFAKVYFEDFNGDQEPDIVMWRKLYKSRLTNDSVKGFETTADLLVHYAFTDDAYQIQQTSQVQIRNWLSAKNLTWQKGYPSQNECPNQTSQLIPEMHDPMLNDPEVLQ